MNRRHFIKTTVTAALAASATNIPHQLRAAEPTKWLVGVRDVYLKSADPADGWNALKLLNADCFEAEVDDNLALSSFTAPDKKYTVGNAEGIATLKADLKANGRRIGAFCMHNKFDQRLEKEIELCTRLAAAADELGVPAIRIDVVPRALKIEEFPAFATKACRQLCDATKGAKVRYGIENHGRATNDPAIMEQILNGVGSRQLGITLDTANLYWWGHPLDEVYQIYQRFAPHAVHTHCKNINYPADQRNVKRQMGWEYAKYCCPLYEGDLDFNRIVADLRQAGYTGDLCVENESLGRFTKNETAEILRKEIAFLRQLS